MAHFFKLRGRMDEVARQYFKMTQDASSNLPKEHAACQSIQSFYRATRIRKTWHAIINGTLLIQRCIRGWLARERTKALRLERRRRLNEHFFHHCATVVQKYFRGWWSRKHLHHFHGRKGYLEKVAKRGEYTTDWLQKHHEKQLVEAKMQEEMHMRQEFDNLAGELHHLISTKAISGVYNPPYSDALPRAFEKPIEQHLRDSCKAQVPKSLRRPRHRRAIAESCSPRMGGLGGLGGAGTGVSGLSQRDQQDFARATATGPPQDLPNRSPHAASRSASVGRMQKIQGPFRSREQLEVATTKATLMHRTIQAAAPYELLDEDRKMQQRLSKLTRVSPIDFCAPGMPPERPPPSSVHTSVPYRERPVELRSDYTELPKIRDKPPFFTAMPHDKHFAEYHEQPLLVSGHV